LAGLEHYGDVRKEGRRTRQDVASDVVHPQDGHELRLVEDSRGTRVVTPTRLQCWLGVPASHELKQRRAASGQRDRRHAIGFLLRAHRIIGGLPPFRDVRRPGQASDTSRPAATAFGLGEDADAEVEAIVAARELDATRAQAASRSWTKRSDHKLRNAAREAVDLARCCSASCAPPPPPPLRHASTTSRRARGSSCEGAPGAQRRTVGSIAERVGGQCDAPRSCSAPSSASAGGLAKARFEANRD